MNEHGSSEFQAGHGAPPSVPNIHEHAEHGHHAHHVGHGHGHHGPSVKTYMAVFGALLICTLVSFVANVAVRQGVMGAFASFAIIFLVACLKATLVAVWFMHLKFDWNKVYVMIVPALILGPMLIIVLLPDIVLAWKTTGP
ncbi:MAG: cytochrome C oxidase subunit IV family protein [Gemmataceae bacterium]|nr:cytochrome C oxidase subunit IV family protein [Gemmataceae bacterium]